MKAREQLGQIKAISFDGDMTLWDFEAACRQAGCKPEELMHVGDSLDSDIQGARAVGAVSVWLNRKRTATDSDMRPDFEIHSLAEIETILNHSADESNKADAGEAMQRA